MKMTTPGLVIAAAALLAACGGGGGGPPEPPVAVGDVPAAATASTAAFVRFVGDRPASDSAEPLVVSDVVAPTRDDEEPVELD